MIGLKQRLSLLVLQVEILQDDFVEPFDIDTSDPYGYTQLFGLFTGRHFRHLRLDFRDADKDGGKRVKDPEDGK